MSLKGIYTAVSGAIAQDRQLTSIANNLANVNTPGFKKDDQIFREYLTSFEKPSDVIQVPRVPASVESFYDMQGGDKSFVENVATHTDFHQGALKNTSNPLDVAIEGDGFFEVLTKDGVKFTRNGSFQVDNEGRLVTSSGYPVLREGSPAENPITRIINVPDSKITIDDQGQIFSNDKQDLGRLSITTVKNKDGLIKEGSSLYGLNNQALSTLQVARGIKVHQGLLESSNVNVVEEMSNMIATHRIFESTQKVIQAYDKMSEKLNNEVPRLRV